MRDALASLAGPDGAQLSTASSGGTVSAGGRFVAYGTEVPGSHSTEVFVKDLRTGASAKVPGTGGETYGTMISPDGRYVAYDTGTYHFHKPYVYDRATGLTQPLWPADPPTDSYYESGGVTGFSADGRHVAYIIGNRNGSTGSRHMFVRDLTTGTDDLVDPVDHPGNLWGGRLSADGRFVAFMTQVGSDTALYVKDRTTGGITRFDTAPDGTPADDSSSIVDISADGRRVLFDSYATNLLPGTPPATRQQRAYVADLSTGRIRRVGGDGAVALAADGSGRFVLLRQTDAALVLADLRTGRQRAVPWPRPRRPPPPSPARSRGTAARSSSAHPPQTWCRTTPTGSPTCS